MTWKGKKVLVFGAAGRTGEAVLRFLQQQQAELLAYDQRPGSSASVTAVQRRLREIQIDWILGREPKDVELDVDQIIVSPGVPIDHPGLVRARQRGVSVCSEIELASRNLTAPLIAITGSQGKSTTTALLGHLLSGLGKRAFVGGNFGRPLIEACSSDWDVIVAEISSFQLEGVQTFHPQVGLLLNLLPNHLDRHGDLATYRRMKERLFAHMGQHDRAVCNADDPALSQSLERIAAPVWTFSTADEGRADFHFDQGDVKLPSGEKLAVSEFTLPGEHNRSNLLAAIAGTYAITTSLPNVNSLLSTFEGLPHRLEEVGVIDHVRFVNDSKSTTPTATAIGINAMEQPVILLAGGRSKGLSYRKLVQALNGRVRDVVLFGEAVDEMKRDLGSRACHQASTLREAFSKACTLAQAGDTVLLSPANASFDEFENFEMRGECFRDLVQATKTVARDGGG